MSTGYLLLHVALAVVALWLVAELLLQNRAPLLWRAVALTGFACVVVGMQLQSVPVIGLGAAGFALGQTFVTLAVKRGRPVGWSLRRPDGSLPGPLAKVPLLSAATGGVAVAAVAVETPLVGEVGPIEDEPEPGGLGYEELQELESDGVYAQEPAAAYYQPQADGYYQQGAYIPEQQQWQQQPVAYGYDQYGQPVYQDPYGNWGYAQPQQQAYPGIPQQQTQQSYDGYQQQY